MRLIYADKKVIFLESVLTLYNHCGYCYVLGDSENDIVNNSERQVFTQWQHRQWPNSMAI